MLQYLSPQDFLDSPFGVGFANQLSQLAPGILEKRINKASELCNLVCKRRLQAPLPSLIAAPGAQAGDITLPIVSTLGYDGGSEYCLFVGKGTNNEEIVPIEPGGIETVDFTTPPYPGIIHLSSPLAYNHAEGEAIQGAFVEESEAGSSGNGDVIADIITQDAQLAQAHRPYSYAYGTMARYIFLKNYPIQVLYTITIALPYSTIFQKIDANVCNLSPQEGFYRIPLGMFIPEHSLVKTTYLGGFYAPNAAMKEAVEFFLASDLAVMFNVQGAISVTMGKRTVSYGQRGAFQTYSQMGESVLRNAGLVRTF